MAPPTVDPFSTTAPAVGQTEADQLDFLFPEFYEEDVLRHADIIAAARATAPLTPAPPMTRSEAGSWMGAQRALVELEGGA